MNKKIDKLQIKPCPFCGKVPILIKHKNQLGTIFYSVDCSNEKCDIQPFTNGFSTEEKAIEIWNTRNGEK